NMDYLTGKWKLWYKMLDVNHDGKISIEDVEESRNKFTNLHELLEEKAKGVKVDMENWWTEYIFGQNGPKEISEADFVKRLQTAYETDKAAFVKKMEDCFNTIFDVIDTNKDRQIELDEFVLVFKAFGHENEQAVTKFFGLYNAPAGIPIKDIVAAYVKFTTSDNSNDTDYVNQSLKLVL
ncbi:hypothetical protein FSP39_013703, partial [Pinctada imbricata]